MSFIDAEAVAQALHADMVRSAGPLIECIDTIFDTCQDTHIYHVRSKGDNSHGLVGLIEEIYTVLDTFEEYLMHQTDLENVINIFHETFDDEVHTKQDIEVDPLLILQDIIDRHDTKHALFCLVIELLDAYENADQLERKHQQRLVQYLTEWYDLFQNDALEGRDNLSIYEALFTKRRRELLSEGKYLSIYDFFAKHLQEEHDTAVQGWNTPLSQRFPQQTLGEKSLKTPRRETKISPSAFKLDEETHECTQSSKCEPARKLDRTVVATPRDSHMFVLGSGFDPADWTRIADAKRRDIGASTSRSNPSRLHHAEGKNHKASEL